MGSPGNRNHQIPRAQYFKTCNPDQDNPDNEILIFSVLDQGDPADFIRVFQNTGRVDHRDPDLGGDGFPNLVTPPPDRNMADYLTKGAAGNATSTSKM